MKIKKKNESGLQAKTKGTADEVDKHVGNRLRIRRTILGLSQDKLAEATGVTFQQVQKYERGANRMSASRLFTFSKFLDVPITYFYEDLKEGSRFYGFSDNDQEEFDHEAGLSNLNSLLSKRETIELLKVYYSVKDAKKRKDLVKFLKSVIKK